MMERLHVLECEDDIGEANSRDDDSNGPNRDRILGAVSLKANCLAHKQQSHRMVAWKQQSHRMVA